MAAVSILLIIFGALACLVMLYQDLRSRLIHISPLIALGICGIGYNWKLQGELAWREFLANIVFLVLVVGTSMVIVKLRNLQHQVVNSKIGTGDLWFLVAAAFWLDPFGYAIYFVSSILLILVGVALLVVTGRWDKSLRIPLAGLMAGYLIFFAPIYWVWEDWLWAWGMSWMLY